jgi:hypothetical protein
MKLWKTKQGSTTQVRRAIKMGAVIGPFYRLPIEFLAVAVVAITGHLGGYLSGVNIPS